jgi:Antitoxin VbhA
MCIIWYNEHMNSSMKEREQSVKQAIANERLEGLKVSPEARKIADSYIAGKASASSVAAKIRARYGNI